MPDTEAVLKFFGRFGANGLLVAMLWAILAALTTVGKLPTGDDTLLANYKTFLQYAFATIALALGLMLVTWNMAGVPKRLDPNN